MARIGPNAVLQLHDVLQDAVGADVTARLMAMAGIADLPDPDAGLMEEGPAVRLHQAMRSVLPERAPALAREAGRRTGDYILGHRIPAGARRLLRLMPARLSAPILAQAVARHAWTFAGSGHFRVVSNWPVVVEIAGNPMVREERAATPLCHWHAAVFAGLFTDLCGPPEWSCIEITCCAQGAPACRFECHRSRGSPCSGPLREPSCGDDASGGHI